MARTRYSLAQVSDLHVIYRSDKVTVEQGNLRTHDGADHIAGAFRVKIAAGAKPEGQGTRAQTRVFYGESAWSAAERMASDVDFAAWGCTR